jgi:hypothetical protein
MNQQIDPIAQAMQILQFVTQRRGQQADIDQGQQRLDLAQQGLQLDRQRGRQQNRQFQQGMDWNRKQAGMQQQQFEQAQQRALVEAAMRNVADQQKFSADEAYRQQMLEQARKQLEMTKIENLLGQLPGLQNQMLMEQNPANLAPLQQRLQQIMQMSDQFHGLKPFQAAPVDPKTARLNAQF